MGKVGDKGEPPSAEVLDITKCTYGIVSFQEALALF